MGIFKLLFGEKKEKSVTPSVSINFTDSSPSDEFFYDERFYELLRERPNMSDYYGRPFDLPKYNDSFNTIDGHALREWLLLVWWGKTKNGRKKDITIPRYFFFNYNLDAEQLTAIFKRDGLLEDTEDKTVLTEKGRVFADKYKILWEIHSFKNFPTNLDFDYPTWNLQSMEITRYEMEAQYYSDNLAHSKKLVNRLNAIRNPAWNKHIQKELDYYMNQSNSDINKLNDLKQKIEILKNKQNSLE